MKPPEILGLIEEAAGIRMFEDKKEDALATLDKKQRQIDEINRMIDTDLNANVERLRRERQQFEEWYALKTELQRRERWLVAYDYRECERVFQEGDALAEAAIRELEVVQADHDQTVAELGTVRTEIRVLTERRNTSEREQLARIEAELEREQARTTKAHALKKQASAEIRRFQHKRERLEGQQKATEATLLGKREDFENRQQAEAALDQKIEGVAQQVTAIERRLNAAKVGIATDGDESSVSDQIQEQKRAIAECDVITRRIENGRPHLLSQQRKLTDQIHRTSRDIAGLVARRDAAMNARASAESALRNLQFDPELERALFTERDELLNQLASYRDRIDRAERQLIGIEFEYTAPPGFNRAEVHGVLVRLISVRDKSYCTAVETTGGGKLYHVVVEREHSAARILEEGRLRRHVTLIPLDRIQSRKISPQTLADARRVARTTNLAQDLLDYDPRDELAVQFAFGQTVICDAPNEAKHLAFTKHLRLKTVTKAGDVYDPIGTLSGGGRADGRSVLARLAEYDELIRGRDGIQYRLRQVEHQLRDLENASRMFKELREQFELASHELEISIEAIAQSEGQTAQNELEKIENELREHASSIEAAAARRRAASQRLGELERAQADWERHKADELGKLERQLKQKQKELDQAKREKSERESAFEMASVEIQEMEKELATIGQDIAEALASIEKNERLDQEQSEELHRAKEAKERAEIELAALKKALSETTDLLAAAIEREEELERTAHAQEQEKKRYEQQIAHYKEEQHSAKKQLKAMRKQYPWILQEERYFGITHTDFDFKLYDPATARAELEDLTEERQKIEPHVNKRAVTMCEAAEHELVVLSGKRDTVENEKTKIIAVIGELEIKTREAIERTHLKVDRELSDIVRQVLPGSTAQLRPVKDGTLYTGLELTVAFSNVQKGLQELSGGQRSLIALALVLALLKFKPAPFYILDEIDAALDLNHTYNIGRMLRQSFKASQFIIVSLKEGMWNNANVVFRTSFRDSTSLVQRDENKPS
jgi:structural maintenance of chromosome 2